MKAEEKRSASRRMKGRFSSRLSNRKSGGRHKSFREVPEYYRLAVESLADYALLTMDRNLIISSWSGPAAKMFGYSEAEIIGKDVAILFTPEDIAKHINKTEFAKALVSGRESDERWHVRKDGVRLWCYGLSFPLKDEKGGVRGFVKLVRDDTQRKRRDDRLRESEERLSLAAESTGLGTWEYDFGKRSITLSKRAAVLFGLPEESPSAAFERFLEVIDPEDRPRIAARFDSYLGPEPKWGEDMEFRIPMGEASVRWVLLKARAFNDEPGPTQEKPNRLIGTVIDITERRRKQQEAQELKAELEVKVKERTARLTALNKELETFAYSASHDLRAPLRKIAAFSHAISKSAQGKLSPEEHGFLDTIRASAAKMQRLIDGQLKLARVTRKDLSLVACDLGEIAREAADELRKSEPGRRVEFVIAGGVLAKADREMLGIALRNLLANAWKFTSKHATARIEFGVMEQVGRPVYFVRDDGAGFEMEFAHKLFRAFHRLHAAEEFPGTGVGLGLVERIIRRHRGRIWAEAEVEKGATFFFTLDTEAE